MEPIYSNVHHCNIFDTSNYIYFIGANWIADEYASCSYMSGLSAPFVKTREIRIALLLVCVRQTSERNEIHKYTRMRRKAKLPMSPT